MANTKKTEVVELTPQQEWKIKREARMAKRNASASELSEGQLRALKQAYIAIRHADFSCHEMYAVDAQDMIAIDKAEGLLSQWFPQITEDAVSELTCTCDED
jgi:hypothetical protein